MLRGIYLDVTCSDRMRMNSQATVIWGVALAEFLVNFVPSTSRLEGCSPEEDLLTTKALGLLLTALDLAYRHLASLQETENKRWRSVAYQALGAMWRLCLEDSSGLDEMDSEGSVQSTVPESLDATLPRDLLRELQATVQQSSDTGHHGQSSASPRRPLPASR